MKNSTLSNKNWSSILFLIFALLFAIPNVFADGTKQVMPNQTNGTALYIVTDPLPGSPATGPYLGGTESQRIYFTIADATQENLYFGVQARVRNAFAGGNNNLSTNFYYQIFDAAGNPQTAPILFTNTNGSAGFINTYSQAVNGPNIGGVTNGYSPITFDPSANGDYYIALYGSNDGGATAATNDQTFPYDPNDLNGYHFLPYFDLTVGNVSDAADPVKEGRIWSRKWSFITYRVEDADSNAGTPNVPNPNSAASFEGNFFAYTDDQVILEVDFTQGFRPFGYQLAMNKYGVVNDDNAANNFLTTRASQTYGTGTAPALRNGYQVFIASPDQNVFIPSAEPNPSLVGGSLNGCPGSYTIPVNLVLPQDTAIVLDLNGTVGYQAGTEDVLIETYENLSGLNEFPWNGLDGLGNPVSSSSVSVIITSFIGRTNIPMDDAELNINGLSIVGIAPNTDNRLLRWDDREIVTTGTVCNASNLPNNITTASATFNRAGLLSGIVGPAHAWSSSNPDDTVPAVSNGGNNTDTLTCNDFGNTRIINTWTYGATKEVTANMTLPSCADDADGDGVNDNVDLDNDNDGILDSDEGSCPTTFNTDWQGETVNQAPSTYTTTAGGITATYNFGGTGLRANFPSVSGNAGDNRNLYDDADPDGNGGGDGDVVQVASADGAVYNINTGNNAQTTNISFSSPVSNLRFSIGDLDIADFVTITAQNDAGSTIIPLYVTETGTPSYNIYAAGAANNPTPGIKSVVGNGNNVNNTSSTLHIRFDNQTVTSVSITSGFLDNDGFYDVPDTNTTPGDAQSAAYILIGDLFFCSPLDTDNDNIPDYLDTDSDNDGCSDAYEVGATTDLTPNFQFSDLSGDADGLSPSVDPDGDGVPNYTATLGQVTDGVSACPAVDPCDAAASGNPDNDGDNVSDECDLDDDNDGILDTVECPNLNLTRDLIISTAQSGALEVVEGGASGTPYVTDAGPNGDEEGLRYIDQAANPTFYRLNTQGGDYLYLDGNNLNFRIYLEDAGEDYFGGTTDIRIGSGATQLTLDLTQDPFGQTVPTVIGDYTITVPLTAANFGVTQAQFDSVLSALDYVDIRGEFWLGPTGTLESELIPLQADPCDFDGDGIPNQFDTDSDNDGCFDALEGGDNILLANILPNGQLDGTVDTTTGVPNNVDVNDGQPVGTSADANAFDTFNQCDSDGDGVIDANDACPGFDDNINTDGDAYPDGCDDDDDNDGITDADEGLVITNTTPTCGSQTTLNFNNAYTEEPGGDGDINTFLLNETFRFPNVATNVDALVTITELNGTTVPVLDDNNSNPNSFQPRSAFNLANIGDRAYTEYRFDFVTSGGTVGVNDVVIPQFFANFNDVDGNTSYGEQNWSQYTENYTVEDPTELTITNEGDFIVGTSGTTEYPGVTNNFPQVNYATQHVNQSSYTLRLGVVARVAGASASGRQHNVQFDCATNFTNPSTITTVDSDNDGIPNHLDTDSDNDGCFDALEGNGGITFAQVDGNGMIIGTVNANGIPNAANSGNGQDDVSSTNANVSGAACTPIAQDDEDLDNAIGSIVTLDVTADNGNGADSDANGTIDPATVTITTTGATDENGDGDNDTLIVVNEGTWTLDESGNLTFTPLGTFTGNPTPITYTVEDNDGNVSNEATVTITYQQPPVTQDDDITGLPTNTPAVVDPFADNGNGIDQDPDGTIDVSTVNIVTPGAT
ncbi:hypothetical protein, partial [Lacinutrix chionoecetis]